MLKHQVNLRDLNRTLSPSVIADIAVYNCAVYYWQSRYGMNHSEDEDTDATVDRVEVNEAVREIFDRIFDGPMEEFKQPLEFIKENKFGAVWRNDTERKERVISFAKDFLKAVTANIHSQYAEAAKHIEGSTCDLFLEYVCEKLDDSVLGQDPFQDSCKEIKDSIINKISRIKKTLENNPDKQPTNKSELEVMISQTELLDPIHIRHSLLCCQVARECKDPEAAQKSLDGLGKEHLLSGLSVSYENDNVPKYVMANCGDVLYVSFEGVQSHNLGSTEKTYRGEICTGISV